jgi:protein-L-isoaspartate(D-aspartate) O-methyltransferase
MRGKGVVAKNLIAAFEATPRRGFLPDRWQNVAWAEGMIPIECGEAIEGVDLQAEILGSLAIEPGHRVLEVGTGSGYSAAVMARLAARVVTVERYRTLTEQARQRFEALAITNAFVRQADGSNGLASEGPFDRIVVWAAFENLPRGFVDQLSSGGVMIAPIGHGEAEQVLTRLTKLGSRFEREDIGKVRLQPIAQNVAAVL